MSPGIQIGHQAQPEAPLAIVISQPDPSFLFSDSPHATRVKLAITRPPAADAPPRLSPGLLSPDYGLPDSSGAGAARGRP